MIKAFRGWSHLVLACIVAMFLHVTLPPPPAQADVFDWMMKYKARRNQESRERLLNILKYQGVITQEGGRFSIHNQAALDRYYNDLRGSGALSSLSTYANDTYNEKAGQFWRNFFDRKDYLDKYPVADMDPFQNDNSGLATRMHEKLSSAENSVDYASTASDLHERGIDIIEKELRRGVSEGADTMIKSLNAITGGTSGQAVKWIDEAIAAGAKINDDKAGTLKAHLQSKINDAVQEAVTDKLKAAIGEDRFDKMMEKYEKYGDKQQRLQKLMDDMYKVSGDERFKDASKLLDKASTEAIAGQISAKSQELLDAAKGTDKGKDKEKDTADTGEKAGKEYGAKKKGAAKTDQSEKSGKDGQTSDPTPGKTGQSGPGKSTTPEPPKDEGDDKSWEQKAWDDMTDAERRQALKANDSSAWEKFRDLMLKDPIRAAQILDAKGKTPPDSKAQSKSAELTPPPPPATDPKDVLERLRGLNDEKLKKALKGLGLEAPAGFMNCLCASAGYGSSTTAQFYHPETIGEYNANYSCSQPGPPCVVSGFGCSRYPFPASAQIWDSCMAEHHINTTKTPDGKDDPKSGERLDNYISKLLKARRSRG